MVHLGKIDRIVFYGCSYTFGSELADHDVIPHLSIDEIDHLKRKLGNAEFYKKFTGKLSNDNMLLRTTLENKRSWAGKFGDILSKPVINRAKPGSSNAEMIYTLEYDLKTHLIQENDLLVLALTSKDRMMYFDRLGSHTSVVFHNEDTRWPDPEVRDNFIYLFVNDFYSSYSFHKDLCHVSHLVKNVKQPILVQFVHSPYFVEISPELRKNQKFTEIITQQENFSFIIDPELSFSLPRLEWAKIENQHGFVHPKEHLHEKFANLVATSFKEKYTYE